MASTVEEVEGNGAVELLLQAKWRGSGCFCSWFLLLDCNRVWTDAEVNCSDVRKSQRRSKRVQV